MSQASISGRDIYVRHTDTNGKSHVEQHRVWDRDRFIASRQADASQANAKVEGDGKRLAKVELITAEQFKAAKT